MTGDKTFFEKSPMEVKELVKYMTGRLVDYPSALEYNSSFLLTSRSIYFNLPTISEILI